MPRKIKYRTDIPGFKTRYNSKGYCIVELDFFADPDKRDPRWAAAERKKYPNERMWRREMCRDWTTAAGEAFYPEFQEEKDKYVHEVPYLLPHKPIVRGWDFGFLHTAVAWAQVDNNGRVVIFREVMPDHIDIHNFRDLVLYLSGQVRMDYLEGARRFQAIEWIEVLKNSRHYPNPPWFPPGMRFYDFGGHDANRHHPIVSKTKEATYAEVLSSAEIHLGVHLESPKARETVFRRLLMDMEDGRPGLWITPWCPILIEGLAGGIAYPKTGTIANPEPQEPAKDGYYEHIYDAAANALVNMAAVTTYTEKPDKMVWVGRELKKVKNDESFDLYETRGSYWD